VIRIVLAEDQAMVRGALSALLRLESDFDVVAEAADGDSALKLVKELAPDVLVTDIEMPGRTGLDIASLLHQQNSAVRIVILTTFARPGFLKRALSSGVLGYLLKDSPSDQLATSIRRVAQGQRAIDPELALTGWDGEDPLSERERVVLRLASEGKTAGEIATTIHLSEGTVRNYLSEAIGKLGAANRIEAARVARDNGWL
jgi:two-component system response regulator DesR